MEVHVFRFAFRRRLGTALHPLGLALVLGAVHLLWVRPGSWVSVALLATCALLSIRAVQWLWSGREPLRLDDQGLVHGRVRVPLKGCALHLRTRRAGPQAFRVDEVVVLTPADASGPQRGVSFDVSLIDFERALTLLLERIPDVRVKVRAPGGKELEPGPRQALLAPFQSPLVRALGQAGRGGLPPPARPG